MNEAPIVVKDLGKTYRSGFAGRRRVEALKNVTLKVSRGEIYGFLGPNGAGKTTALLCMLGLLQATQGRAQLFGKVPCDTPLVFRKIGYVPEDFNFYTFLTAEELMRFYGKLYGLEDAHIASRSEMLLDKLGLSEARHRRIKTFSKGMKQRLALAHALLPEPELLFLDEPTRGLDPAGVKLVRDILTALAEKGATVFLNSHVLSEVEMVSTRVGILNRGRMVWEGSPHKIPGASEARLMTFRLPEGTSLKDYPSATLLADGTHRAESENAESLYRLIDAVHLAGGEIMEVSRSRHLEDHFLQLVQDGKKEAVQNA